MRVIHELCGYDRATDVIAVEYLIPADVVPTVRTIVEAEADDADLLLAYDVTPENVRRLASMLKISVDEDRYNYTIEASAPGEEVPAGQTVFTDAR